MMPKWFKTDELPYDAMWVDDRFWLPLVLQGQKVAADFIFKGEGGELANHNIQIVAEL